ncbi:Ribonuclease P protein subunit [Mycena sanguinolenta]|uniref:Ribonuclease P protein subunit n=1 Tax=Mycena sanguinolenta TaxID=230812 RepID=A0A8H6Z776_9AGAR|nr:Ribonuclease P protein subunit [Mycena sanguinolenta]
MEQLYRQLPAVKAAQKLKLTAADPFTPQYVQSMATQASNPAEIYSNRVKGRMLMLDNAAKESRLRQERNANKLGVLGRRQGTARELGLWGFDERYMSELLNLPQPSSGPPRPLQGASIHPKLLKADFHGSIITVHQSKNTATLGISGIIVIHETEGTFKVVTKENKLEVLPKQNSIFTFAVPAYSTLPPTHNASVPLPIRSIEADDTLQTVLIGPHVRLELHGNQFCFRSADRAGRKFKAKESIEL